METTGAMGIWPLAIRSRLGSNAAIKIGTQLGDFVCIMWYVGAAKKATTSGIMRNRTATGIQMAPMMK